MPQMVDIRTEYADEYCDVILRSSDHVNFLVHQRFLSKGSRFFKNMFSLAKTSGEHTPPSQATWDNKQLAVVDMAEDEESLDLLIQYLYPAERPYYIYDDLQVVSKALSLAKKFNVLAMREHLKVVLSTFNDEHPERIFYIASHFKIYDVALDAARKRLRQPILELLDCPELRMVDGTKVRTLLHYHRRCVYAVQDLLADLTWIELSDLDAQITSLCRCCPMLSVGIGEHGEHGQWIEQPVHGWFAGYIRRARAILSYRLKVSEITSPELFHFCLSHDQAMACNEFQWQLAFRAIQRFSAILSNQVENTIDVITLSLPGKTPSD